MLNMIAIFSLSKHQNPQLKNFYEKAMDELREFYGINWINNRPAVFIVNSRKDINQLRGKETPAWLVGWSANRAIYLLSPNTFEKESDHKYSPDRYYKLLKHELNHAFLDIVAGSYIPKWLNEGTCSYVSGQILDKKKPASFESFLSFQEKSGKEVYKESGFAVELLVKEYGKNKFTNFLKSFKNNPDKSAYEAKYKEIFGSDLSYETFNTLLKKHSEKKT